MDNPVALLEPALLFTGQIVTGITPDQWGRPTPCDDWDVRAVANHLVGGLRIFTTQIHGVAAEGEHDAHDWLGADPATAYLEAARADLAAWQMPETLRCSFVLSFGEVPGPLAAVIHLTEVVVHGIDLAVATGQEELVDQRLASGIAGAMQQMGIDGFRVPGIFGQAVPAPADARPHEQLLAYLGRNLPEPALA
jgi:uncharacterized protein (TIGR03086 family)